MITNPYWHNGILLHVTADRDEGGCAETACGLLVGVWMHFEGFEPMPCPECFPDQEAP